MGIVSDFNSLEKEFTEVEASKSWKILFTNLRADSDKFNEGIESQAAKNPINKLRNRYRDVLPFDHTRVVVSGIGNNDYINASYVELNNSNRKRRYILTQGPLTNTIPHFWRMVWTEGSKCIVMLNKLIEKDVIKCAQYFPIKVGETISHEYDDLNLRVSLTETIDKQAYVQRVFTLEDTLTGQIRNVVQFHYLSWPDFGVPLTPESFLQFLVEVRASGGLDDVDRPCVVHCSAGIGRSGTFVLIDLALLRINEYDGGVDLQAMLLELRKCRMGLVQAPEQLRFAYLAIIFGAKSMLKNLDTDDRLTGLSELECESDCSDNSDAVRSNWAIDNAGSAARSRRGLASGRPLEDVVGISQSNRDNANTLTPNVSDPKTTETDDRKILRQMRFDRTRQKVEEIRANMRRQDLERDRWIDFLRPARWANRCRPYGMSVTVFVGVLSLVCGLALYKYVT